MFTYPHGFLGAAAVYAPGMMTYDGASYYSKTSVTTSGNKVTGIFRFNRSSFTGASLEWVMDISVPGTSPRLRATLFSSDHATTESRGRVQVQTANSSNVTICKLISTDVVCNGTGTLVFYEFDGDAGTGKLWVSSGGAAMADADDAGNTTRVAPTTGTLASGASSAFYVGSTAAPSLYNNGEIGYVWLHDVSGLTPSDFGTGSAPAELDTATWTELGSQPLFGQDEGNLSVENLGSAGLMTKTGTITGPA